MSLAKSAGVVTLLACLFFLTSAAGATLTVLYDNLSGTSFAYSISSYGPEYNSFSTEATSFSLTQVDVLVYGTATADPPGSFTVGLYADNSTSPGTLIQLFATVYDSTLDSTIHQLTYNNFSPIPLSTNKRYWVGLVADPTYSTEAAWAYTFFPGIGDAGEYWTASSVVYPNYNSSGSTGPYQMKVSGVPLPPSILLLSSGLVGLGFLRRKWRLKK